MKIKSILAVGAIAAVAVLAPATAQAGNGTSNFYLTGHCGINKPLGVWAALDFTNYDSGANQVYHTSVTRSGVGVIVDGVYVDGVRKGSSLEQFITVSGHGSHQIKLTVHEVIGGPRSYCAVQK